MHDTVSTLPDGTRVVDVYFTADTIECMFPTYGDNGQVVGPQVGAIHIAEQALAVPAGTELKWVTPDVFNIRYGSSWVATASLPDRKVRFHTSDQGDWQEGDDHGYD